MAVDSVVIQTAEATVELRGHAQPSAARQRRRMETWPLRLALLDVVAIVIAAVTGVLARFGWTATTTTFNYVVLAGLLVPGWMLAMAVAGAYDRGHLTAGMDQYRRVLNGAAWLLALVAIASFVFHADLSRGFVLLSIPYATVLTLMGRYIARKGLHRDFARGEVAHRVLAIGSPREVNDLVVHAHRAAYVGLQVVAALVPGTSDRPELPAGVAWAGGDLTTAIDEARLYGADTLAVAGPHLLGKGALRRLAWELEGTDLELAVVPAVTDIAGPRIRIRPIDGLPLLDVAKPQFSGSFRFVKTVLDRVLAAVSLVVLSPVLLLAALAVCISSPGGAIFRQTRVGQNGRQFTLFKFRSMYADAEIRIQDVRNDNDGVLFKSRSDPRVTPVGRWLRRLSLDELPQLWNVVRGDMSLVGPRPPLPSEVERYGPDVHRRLLVKPGVTGLWQVSGRSDLSWDETVRLDLHYVDNWSVGLDIALILKTFTCVVRGRGAY